MAKVLAISSQTVFGPVGNSAAVPALQAEGHEVLALPTILLSFHPGHGNPVGQRTPAPLMEEMFEKLANLGVLKDCDAVMTGYFADTRQVEVAASVIRAMKTGHAALQVLVDPVLGDDGALYVPEDVARAVRDHLLPLATIATPNAFELSWLTAAPVTDDLTAQTAAAKLPVPEIIITSVPLKGQLATLLIAGARREQHLSQRLPSVPHGTGDFLAGCYLAARLTRPPSEAFAQAMARLERAIARSKGRTVLSLS